MVTAIHIHSPPIVNHKTLRRKCPVCQRRTTMFGWAQRWYGWHLTCLSCGDSWQDGERLPRPFCPRWRQESIRRAKRLRARLGGAA